MIAAAMLGTTTGCTDTQPVVTSLLKLGSNLPKLAIQSETVAREGETATLTVTLSATSLDKIYVDYTTQNLSATSGEDFTLTSGSLVFLPGELSQSISVPLLSDSLYEPTAEQFAVTLSNPTAAQIASAKSLVNITDTNSAPEIEFAVATLNATESSGIVNAQLVSNIASSADIVINYTVSGTTTSGADHMLTDGSVTLPALATAVNIPISIVDDTALEIAETLIITLSLSGGAGATLGSQQNFTLTIADNDNPQIAIDDISSSESSSLVFSVNLSAPLSTDVSVDWTTQDDSAIAGTHYVAASGTLTFSAGQTSKSITITSNDNSVVCESVKEFKVVLSNISGSATFADTEATGAITDPDRPTISIGNSSATEGSSIVANATLSAVCPLYDITFLATTSDGSALSTADYTSLNAAQTIAKGSTSVAISIATVNDAIDEIDETFSLTLSSPVNATISAGTATLTIVDDDSPVLISVTAPTANTEGSSLAFSVSLSSISGKTVLVDYSTLDVSATAGLDYITAAGTLTFSPGETTKTVTVSTLDDGIAEDNESFTFSLVNPVNANLSTSSATGFILDNDLPPSISIDSPTPVIEGANLTFTVTLSAPSEQMITVDYASADGSAVSGSDYIAVVGTLSFNPGELTKTIDVTTLADGDVEGTESFTISLSNPVNSTIATSIGSGTLSDASIAAPTSISLFTPTSSPNISPTATLQIGGLTSGDGVGLYSDSSCTNLVSSGTSGGPTINLATGALSEGLHTFYAKRTSGGIPSPCSTVSLTYHYLSMSVQPLYTNAPNWNQYIRNNGSSVYTATGVLCDGSESGLHSACIHGGEKRKLVLPGFSSCSGLEVRDSLGAFSWECLDASGTATFVTKGLNPDKGLASLLNMTTGTTWNSIFAKLFVNGTHAVNGAASTSWWGNSIQALTSGTLLNSAEKIYTVKANMFTTGHNINADRVALVTAPNVTLTYNGSVNNCDATSGETGSAYRCLVAAGLQKFLWIEGNFSGTDTTNQAEFNVLLKTVSFSKIHNVNLYFSRYAGIKMADSRSNLFDRLSMAYHGASGGLGAALYMISSNENVFYDLNANSNNRSGSISSDASISVISSTGNIFNKVLSASNYANGILVNSSSHNNVFSHVSAVNNGSSNSASGIDLRTSDGNIINQAVLVNNAGTGVSLNDSNSTQAAQIFSRENGASGIAETNGNGSAFHQNVYVDSCYASGGTPGMSSSCTTQNASTAIVNMTLAISNSSFFGKATIDAVNAFGASAMTSFSSLDLLSEYMFFQNPFRVWGYDSPNTFPNADQQGLCEAGNCRIWDYSVKEADTVLKNRNGTFASTCPSSVAGNMALAQPAGAGTYFLSNATELMNDAIGDDDGLCESNEACAYSPNLGAFQNFHPPVVGEPSSLRCTFTNGVVSNVSIYGHYATTMDPNGLGLDLEIMDSNLSIIKKTGTGTGLASARALLGKNSGKWYFEVKVESISGSGLVNSTIGLGTYLSALDNYVGSQSGTAVSYGYDGSSPAKFYTGGAATSGPTTYNQNDVIGVAVDFDSKKIWFSKNGIWQGSNSPDPVTGVAPAFSSISAASLYPMVSLRYGGTLKYQMNFGQRPFDSVPPTGFNPGWY